MLQLNHNLKIKFKNLIDSCYHHFTPKETKAWNSYSSFLGSQNRSRGKDGSPLRKSIHTVQSL